MDALTKEKKADIYVYKKRVVKKYVKQETDLINNVACTLYLCIKGIINFGYRTYKSDQKKKLSELSVFWNDLWRSGEGIVS